MLTPTTTDYRRQILDVARHLLIEDGYKNLSMRKIARQLACSQGTIYLYFKNKDDIFYALIDEGTEQLYRDYQTILTAPNAPRTHLEQICRAYIHFGLTNPGYYETMYILLPLLKKRFSQEQYRRARRFLDLTANTLSNYAAESGRTLSDSFMEATILWAAMHGLVALILARRIDTRLAQEILIEQAIARALNGFCYTITQNNLTPTPS